MKISLIAAMTKNNVIGSNNDIPWMGKLPADMSFFVKNTKGKPVLMGRKTFDSIGKALPNRRNIVVSRNKDLKIDGVEVVSSIEDGISLLSDYEEIMIIGGSLIYEQSLVFANKIYLTIIDSDVDGDAFFPKIGNDWALIDSESHKKDNLNLFNYCFNIYEKTK